jgi:hypothetical protein
MKNYLVILILLSWIPAFGQETEPATDSVETEYAEKTFWSSRIINGQSIETLSYGQLDFRLAHRMGRISSGPKSLFGLYQASSQFNLEYGISDRLMVGLASSTIDKLYCGMAKYKILRQSTGGKKMPVTLTWLSEVAVNSSALDYPDNNYYFSSRLTYTHQVLVARKFNERLSLQFSPTVIHRNMVKTAADKNTVFAFGLAGRYKVTRKMAITAEYYYLLPDQVVSLINSSKVTGPLSAGVEWFLGRHTIQIHLTNTQGMDEKSFITETIERWDKKGIHFGFNIATYFTLAQKEE